MSKVVDSNRKVWLSVLIPFSLILSQREHLVSFALGRPALTDMLSIGQSNWAF